MKVFISHSWKNKTEAQKIADDLQLAGVDLWLDANNLLPGQLIQDTIDDVLQKIDVVVLVWTKEASESGGVAAELFTCSRLKKIIIPCKLDETSLELHPYVAQIKGISFNDFNDGLGRLKMALINYMAGNFNMNDSESIRVMNEFMGTLETANHLVYKENIKQTGTEQEKDFWVKKVQDSCDASHQLLLKEEQAGKEIMLFLQEQMKKLETGLNNKEIVGMVLQEMKAHHFADRPDMKTFIERVQGIYNGFAVDEEKITIERFRQEMKDKLQSSQQQLKSNLGWLADILFAAASENVEYFFLSSADHLEKLLQMGKQQGTHPEIADCANELLKYIKTPGGIIDNSQHGILGYADDAYLVQSLLATMQQEKIIDTSSWNIDWNKITAGSDFIFNIVGQPVKTTLDQNIINFCQSLVAKYQPQVKTEPVEDDYNQRLANLQKAKDDLWKAKLMSFQTGMIHNPIY
jgi:hypothetical protein